MKNLKKIIKAGIAILCCFSVIASGIGMIPKTVKASTTLEEISIVNFGKEDGATLGKATYTGESLLNTVFTGKVRATTSNTSMYYGGSGKWYGIKFNFQDQNLQINNQNISGDNSGTYGAYNFTPAQLDADSFLNEDLEFKITIQEIAGNTTDVQVIIEINGNECLNFIAVKALPAVTSGRGLGKVIETESGNVTISELPKELPMDFHKMTLSDFGAEDEGAYNDSGKTNSSITNMDQTMFSADFIFETGKTQVLNYASGAGGAWNKPFNIYESNGSLLFKLQDNDIVFKNDVATRGITLDTQKAQVDKLVDARFNLKITIEYLSDDEVQIGLWFNNHLYNNKYFTVVASSTATVKAKENFGTSMRLTGGSYTNAETGGTYRCFKGYSVYEIPQDLTKINPKDNFNWPDGTLQSAGAQNTYRAADTVKNTLFSTSVTFTETGARFTYGGKTGSRWNGLIIGLTDEDTITVLGNTITSGTLGTYEATDFSYPSFLYQKLNLQISVREFDLDRDGTATDIELGIFVDGKLCGNKFQYIAGALDSTTGTLGKLLAISDGNNIRLTSMGTTHVAEEPSYYNLAEGDYLLTAFATDLVKDSKYTLNGTVQVDGVAKTVGDALSTPGTYEIVKTETSTGNTYKETVVLWEEGYINKDDKADIKDLVAMLKITDETTDESVKKGADFDYNASVNEQDAMLLRQKLVEAYTIPAKLTYKDNVMPIFGYGAPTVTNSANLLNKTIYKAIADSGINLIVSRNDDCYGGLKNYQHTIETLELAKENGLDVFVTDGYFQWITSDNQLGTFSRRLSLFSKYSSFKGLYVLDEPTATAYPDDSSTLPTTYTYAASKLNSYTNANGYTNLLPCYSSMRKSIEDYENYLAECSDSFGSKVLSFDYYPFDHQENAASCTQYFKNLLAIQKVAKQKNIPFWAMLQAGGQLRTSYNSSIAGPTQAETIWNVNTALACGAKGIGYFPIVQPEQYANLKDASQNSYTEYTRHGLYGANGVKNETWYNAVSTANSQIANIDEILLNSHFVALYGKGEYAEKNTGATLPAEGYKELNSVTTTSNYGTVVGVFNYFGKTALYVVNNDTTNAQTITLRLDSSKIKVYSEQFTDGATDPSGENATSCELPLVAGGAALIVIE